MKKQNITLGSKRDIQKDFQKLRTNRQFLTILILLFISIFFWIVISLISSQLKEEVSKELTDLAKPLNPTIDTEILTKIQTKHSYSNSELTNFKIYKVLTTRDGKTEKVVPLEVNIDDIDPKPTAQPTPKIENTKSLLQSEIDLTETSSATDSTTSNK